MNILYFTNELNYADGVSSHLYSLLSGMKKSYSANIFLICGGGDAINKFEDVGIKVCENTNLNHKNRSIKYFASAILYVYRFSKNNKIDIIHSHNHYAANIAYRSSKFFELQTIQTIHGIIPVTGKLEHIVSGNLITVNNHVYNSVKDNSNDKTNLHLIYNGIEFGGDFEKTQNSKVKFIAASRLESGKGLDTLIKAVSKLPQSFANRAEFFIAGEGSLENELQEINRALGSRINFLGKINNLRDILKKTDVFVCPSLSEGFPMTILEAAAEKNLIISSDFDGIENILSKNENGLIFQRNNPDELKDKMIFAIDNPDIAKNISENFFTEAKSKFSAEKMCEKHFVLYKSIYK